MEKPHPAHRRRTRLVHAGHDFETSQGFVNVPAVRGSTVLYKDTAALKGHNQRYTYGTHGTPTSHALASAWSELAGAAGTAPEKEAEKRRPPAPSPSCAAQQHGATRHNKAQQGAIRCN